MKKMIGAVVAVAVAIAFSAYAAETVTKGKETVQTSTGTEKVKAKETVTPTEEKLVVKEKAKGEKEKTTVKESGTTATVKDVEKMKKGEVAKETVTFKKIEAQGDYIYVMKDKKEMRLKHKLSDSSKKNMLGLKEGETIEITSTYPLTQADLAVITDAKVAAKAEAVEKNIEKGEKALEEKGKTKTK
jgi:hypothetical protein